MALSTPSSLRGQLSTALQPTPGHLTANSHITMANILRGEPQLHATACIQHCCCCDTSWPSVGRLNLPPRRQAHQPALSGLPSQLMLLRLAFLQELLAHITPKGNCSRLLSGCLNKLIANVSTDEHCLVEICAADKAVIQC